MIGVAVAFGVGFACGASVWLFAAAWLEVGRSPGGGDVLIGQHGSNTKKESYASFH